MTKNHQQRHSSAVNINRAMATSFEEAEQIFKLETLPTLSATSEQISTNADKTAENSNSVATAAEEMSTNMDSVAAASEQTSANITNVSQSAEEVKTGSQQVMKSAL